MTGENMQIAVGLGYLVAGRGIMKWLGGVVREFSFTALNIACLYYFFFTPPDSRLMDARMIPTFAAYLALVTLSFALMRKFGRDTTWKFWIAFLTPLAALALIRYFPTSSTSADRVPFGPMFIGISYLAFRSSHLVLEIRNGIVQPPDFLRYFGFCFFLPTISVGPINPYSNHSQAFNENKQEIPAGRALMRILVGLVKYKFLGSFFAQLGYANLLGDDHYHHRMDLFVSILFYYLFLYCNFSGFCDLAIGAAGIIGVPVAENFDNPFAARNVKDFWNRWHITLSTYMRDVVFSPLSKNLVRIFGPANANHAIALTITVVFLLVGIWHGVGWNYAAFGAVHALGVVANHYYTIFLKQRLGRDRFKAYNENRWIRAAAVCVTFCYYAASLMLFANSFADLKHYFSILR